LTFTKGGYETRMVAVAVNNSNVSGVQVNLSPTPRIVSTVDDASLEEGDPACYGTSRPCDVYQTGAHSSGVVEVYMQWETEDADLDLELRCNDEVIEESFRKGGRLEEMNARVPGGQQCEVHVLHKGAKVKYRIFLKFPI
jgi:hypothetical protein